MRNDSHDIIREYWTLKEDPLHPFDERMIREFPSERETILEKRQTLQNLHSKLVTLSDADVRHCVRNLLRAIDKVLEIISASKLGYPLARNQGLIIENYVYGKLLSVINGSVKSPISIGYPNFYYEKEGGFDATPLVALLLTFRDELESINFPDYPTFAAFYEEYKNRILDMWKEENRKRLGRANN